jgi:fluoride ion exporter CrcB/FEX
MASCHCGWIFRGLHTTFSSFGWEAAKMLQAGEWLRSMTYEVLGLLFAVAGIRLGNRF